MWDVFQTLLSNSFYKVHIEYDDPTRYGFLNAIETKNGTEILKQKF